MTDQIQNPIVIVAGQNQDRLYYTGKAGEAYVSRDIGDAFYYASEDEARRKAETMSRAGILEFRAQMILDYEGFQVGTRIQAFDHEPMEGRRDRFAIGTILESNPDGDDERPFGYYLVDVEIDVTFSKNGGRDKIIVPMMTAPLEYRGRIKLVTVTS